MSEERRWNRESKQKPENRDGRPVAGRGIRSRPSALWCSWGTGRTLPQQACQQGKAELTFARLTRSCMPWTSWSTWTSTRRFSSSSCRSRYSSELRSPCPAPPCPPPPAPRMFCSVDGNTVRFRTSVCAALRPGAAVPAAGLDAIARCAGGHEYPNGSASPRAGEADPRTARWGYST